MPDRTSKDEEARAGRRARPDPPNQTGNQESRMNRIARRAHDIYEARGGGQGRALEDWLQAEREIDAEIDAEDAAAR
jgi:hypothetical protein